MAGLADMQFHFPDPWLKLRYSVYEYYRYFIYVFVASNTWPTRKRRFQKRTRIKNYRTVNRISVRIECLRTGKASLKEIENNEVLFRVTDLMIVDGQYRLREREELYQKIKRLVELISKRGNLFRIHD